MAFIAAAPALWGAISAGVAVASGAYSAVQQRNAGINTSNQIKLQARAEADQTRQQEIERRRALVRAISSQNASAGARGVETSGSIGALANTDINDASNDLLIQSANSSTRLRNLASQAANARRSGNAQAAGSLLDTAGRVTSQKYG